jgi:hypothetical protein
LTKENILVYRRSALVDFVEEMAILNAWEEVTACDELGLAQMGA